MSEKNLRDHLVSFYARQSLPSEEAARLRSLAQVDIAGAQGAGFGRGAGRLSKALYGLAACAAVLVLATAYYVLPSDDATTFPKLVAVKVHADWCARCPTIAPIFAELSEKYGNQPVLFVTLDITDEKKRQQARYLASALGIAWVYDEPLESGTIKLLDREQGKVLAILTNSEQVPRMVSALAQALPRRP